MSLRMVSTPRPLDLRNSTWPTPTPSPSWSRSFPCPPARPAHSPSSDGDLRTLVAFAAQLWVSVSEVCVGRRLSVLVLELRLPLKGVDLLNVLADEVLHHVSAVRVHGDAGHDALAIALAEVGLGEADEVVELLDLLLVVLAHGIRVVAHRAEGLLHLGHIVHCEPHQRALEVGEQRGLHGVEHGLHVDLHLPLERHSRLKVRLFHAHASDPLHRCWTAVGVDVVG
eukprot:scaffold23_cov268-Pinguiococcus_pyrenoidosus.AAC.8